MKMASLISTRSTPSCTFKDRAVAVVAVYKGKGHTIDTLKSYLQEITDRIKREQKDQERLKDYLLAAKIGRASCRERV